MRRADRLFQLVQLIRGRRLSTAAFLAQRLEVSLRTVYRDVADLQHQGVPIEGEAGVGYRLGAGFELPPLMFSQAEANALVIAARVAQVWMDDELARELDCALGKIMSVLPASARVAAEAQALFSLGSGLDPRTQETLKRLRTLGETTRDDTLVRARQQLASGRDPEEVLQFLAHTLTNRLLHPPTAALREASLSGDTELVRAAERMFPSRATDPTDATDSIPAPTPKPDDPEPAPQA